MVSLCLYNWLKYSIIFCFFAGLKAPRGFFIDAVDFKVIYTILERISINYKNVLVL